MECLFNLFIGCLGETLLNFSSIVGEQNDDYRSSHEEFHPIFLTTKKINQTVGKKNPLDQRIAYICVSIFVFLLIHSSLFLMKKSLANQNSFFKYHSLLNYCMGSNVLIAGFFKTELYRPSVPKQSSRIENQWLPKERIQRSINQELQKNIAHEVQLGNLDTVKSLIDRGDKIDVLGPHNQPLLHLAIEKKQIEIAELLIKRMTHNNQYLNPENRRGETSLHAAIRMKQKKIAKVLINHNINLNAANQYRETPLHTAAETGQTEIVQALINRFANLNPPNQEGRTPLHVAIQMRQREVAKVLIDSEVDLNVKDRKGHTPLHCVAKSGDVKIATILVNKKVNLNAVDNMNATPLHLAVYNWNLAIADLLLKCGATVNTKDCFGKTPFDLLTRFLLDPDLSLLTDFKSQLSGNILNFDDSGKSWISHPFGKVPSSAEYFTDPKCIVPQRSRLIEEIKAMIQRPKIFLKDNKIQIILFLKHLLDLQKRLINFDALKKALLLFSKPRKKRVSIDAYNNC